MDYILKGILLREYVSSSINVNSSRVALERSPGLLLGVGVAHVCSMFREEKDSVCGNLLLAKVVSDVVLSGFCALEHATFTNHGKVDLEFCKKLLFDVNVSWSEKAWREILRSELDECVRRSKWKSILRPESG